jgi:outer membrane protein assembly factor BamB
MLTLLVQMVVTGVAEAAGSAGRLPGGTDWPQIGGPNGGFAVTDPGLRDDWTGAEAKVAWRVKLTGPATGRGVSIAAAQVFLVDNDANGTNAILRVLGLDDGKERWQCAWPTGGDLKAVTASFSLHGCVPAVASNLVYYIGECRGQKETAVLRAIDQNRHQVAWTLDPATKNWSLVQAASPIVVDDLVLVPCGMGRKKSDLLLALDRHTGAVRWTCEFESPGDHSQLINAPQVATLGGVRQIVMHHQGGVGGVALDGKKLWNWDGYQRKTLRSTPSISPDGHIFVASGHEGSSALLQVTRTGDTWTCTTVYADGLRGRAEAKKDSPFAPFCGPHLVEGNDFYNSGAWWDNSLYVSGFKGLHCARADGTIAWYGTRNTDKEGTSVIAVNGRILTLSQVKGKGTCLIIAKADSKAYSELAAVPLHNRLHNVELAFANGRLVSVSPLDGEVVCVDLGAKRP